MVNEERAEPTETITVPEAVLVFVISLAGVSETVPGVRRVEGRRGPEYLAPEWTEIPLFTVATVTIGRDPDSVVCINSPDISRRHAEMTYGDGHYLLRDIGSRNGTFVDDKRLGKTRFVRFRLATHYDLVCRQRTCCSSVVTEARIECSSG